MMATGRSIDVADRRTAGGTSVNVTAPWFRVASFPDRTAGNPSTELFYQGLAVHGVALTTRLVCEPAWIRRHASALDAIHVHWPEKIWRGKTRGRWHRVVRFVTLARYRAVFAFARALNAARKAGVKRIWTVHNIEPHEGAGWLDRLGYRIAAENMDLAICYSEAAAVAIRARYPRLPEVIAIPHGNYAGIYPPPRDRLTVLRELGLDPERPMVCCIGIIRDYKGLDVACKAVGSLKGSVQLAICGAPHSAAATAAVKAEMRNVPGVLRARALNDQEFSDVVASSDVVLLPYRKITGSGSLLAAWTLGRGVIASDLPLFREMLARQPEAGELFRAEDADSLAQAITRYLERPPAARERAALMAAHSYSWDRTVTPVVAVMERWKKR